MELEGRTAVVTGGGNGIGRAIVLALAERGANVAVVDVEREAAGKVAAEASSRGIAAAAYGVDVRDADAVESLAEECWATFGSVELLFNNAGVMAPAGPVWLTEPRDVDWVLGVNLVGVLNGLRAFVPRFIASGAPRRSPTRSPPRRRDTTATIAMTLTTSFVGSRRGSGGMSLATVGRRRQVSAECHRGGIAPFASGGQVPPHRWHAISSRCCSRRSSPLPSVDKPDDAQKSTPNGCG